VFWLAQLLANGAATGTPDSSGSLTRGSAGCRMNPAFLHQGGLGKSSQPKGFEEISIRKLAEGG
jgi:hypothetical protein